MIFGDFDKLENFIVSDCTSLRLRNSWNTFFFCLASGSVLQNQVHSGTGNTGSERKADIRRGHPANMRSETGGCLRPRGTETLTKNSGKQILNDLTIEFMK